MKFIVYNSFYGQSQHVTREEALGYFKWAEADKSIVPQPAAWMRENKLRPAKIIAQAQPERMPLFD
jgi:hypothetical protein